MSRIGYTLYQWQRHRLAGWPLSRWAMFVLGVLGLLALVVWPRAAPLAILMWGLAVAGGVLMRWAHPITFVRFSAQPPDQLQTLGTRAPLLPGETLSLFVTGEVRVGDRSHFVFHAPGFVEAFRNGESVVAALSLPSRYAGVAVLPPEYEGMGYVFLPAKELLEVTPGEMHVNGRRWPALRVTARMPEGRRVLHLACNSQDDLRRLWATWRA